VDGALLDPPVVGRRPQGVVAFRAAGCIVLAVDSTCDGRTRTPQSVRIGPGWV
jgi:hypothetical protein